MKHLHLALSVSLFSTLALAEGAPVKSLAAQLRNSTCEMKILKSPLLFGKDSTKARSGQLIFIAVEESHSLRRLPVGRRLLIDQASNRMLKFDDPSIYGVCVLDLETRKCSQDIKGLTLEKFEVLSGENIKISCKKDKVTDM